MLTSESSDIDPSSSHVLELHDAYSRDGEIVYEEQELSLLLDIIRKYKDEETDEPPIAVPVVNIWLVRNEGRDSDPIFYLQERRDNKRLDKTVSGYISSDLLPNETAEKEVSEEMNGARLRIVHAMGRQAFVGVDLTQEPVVVNAGVRPWQISRSYDDYGYYKKPTRVSEYFGVFEGNMDDVTNDEVEHFEELSYSEIQEAIRENPDRFTPDVIDNIDRIAKMIMEDAKGK